MTPESETQAELTGTVIGKRLYKFFSDKSRWADSILLGVLPALLSAISASIYVDSFAGEKSAIFSIAAGLLTLVGVPVLLYAASLIPGFFSRSQSSQAPRNHYWFFTSFVRWFPAFAGSLFFGFLIASSFSPSEKLTFGVAFVFFAMLRDCQEIFKGIQDEDRDQLAWIQFQILNSRLSGTPVDDKAELDRFRKRHLFCGTLLDDGSTMTIKLVAIYSSWVAVGWLLSIPFSRIL